uniref:Si:ch211-197h24.6 n=1 Tax=Poecilia reticulata TaxID=8081 RepID=A0A3P9Q042_POERE
MSSLVIGCCNFCSNTTDSISVTFTGFLVAVLRLAKKSKAILSFSYIEVVVLITAVFSPVFSKGHAFLSVPSLSKVLKDITDSIIGLQYVWEYRSPSKMVQPHYQCKLCSLSRVQHDMVDHVKGWKHSFRYMKKNHPDKVIWEEEDGVKDPAIRKAVKVSAAEVEKAEGRGQIRVILKEPYLVLAFKGLRELKFRQHACGAETLGENLRLCSLNQTRWTRFVTYFFCLQESFQIENENDAQLVLKVTQRLTDVLMEYRLRTIPASTFCNPSLNFSNTPPRLQNDRYSSNHSGTEQQHC